MNSTVTYQITYNGCVSPKRRRGFTLIELLVVLAITSLLFLLVFKPLINSFDLTSRASTQIESQAGAREAVRLVSDLISNATYIPDNTSAPINLWFHDSTGAKKAILTNFALLEYVLPAREGENSVTATIDPTTDGPFQAGGGGGNFVTPLAPGRVLGRFFTGLRNNAYDTASAAGTGVPALVYGNRWDDPRTVSPNQDNRYTLYRAEVTTSIQDPANAGSYIPNVKLFHLVDPATNANVDDVTKTNLVLRLHDPNFFYDDSLAGDQASKGNIKWAVPGWRPTPGGDGKVHISENWKAVSSSLLSSKADTVQIQRDTNNAIVYDAAKLPIPRPLVTFKPTYVNADSAVPSQLSDSGNESPNAASQTYRTQFGHWAGSPATGTSYRVLVHSAVNGVTYEADGDGTVYVTTDAAKKDIGPGIDPVTGAFTNANAAYAFSYTPYLGVVNFSFPSSVVVRDAQNNPAPCRYSPVDINATYYNPPAGMVGGLRALELSTLGTANYNGTPLNNSFKTPFSVFAGAHIVPGSEKVFGPDQRAGNNYGHRMQYTRVSSDSDVGQNQYAINYDPISPGTNPELLTGYMRFDSHSDKSSEDLTLNAPQYFQDRLPETVVLLDANGAPIKDQVTGRNKVGPADAVEVTYSFQMNQPGDSVSVDYYTRDEINLSLEARYYDPASATPQVTTLTDKIKVRNLLR